MLFYKFILCSDFRNYYFPIRFLFLEKNLTKFNDKENLQEYVSEITKTKNSKSDIILKKPLVFNDTKIAFTKEAILELKTFTPIHLLLYKVRHFLHTHFKIEILQQINKVLENLNLGCFVEKYCSNKELDKDYLEIFTRNKDLVADILKNFTDKEIKTKKDFCNVLFLIESNFIQFPIQDQELLLELIQKYKQIETLLNLAKDENKKIQNTIKNNFYVKEFIVNHLYFICFKKIVEIKLKEKVGEDFDIENVILNEIPKELKDIYIIYLQLQIYAISLPMSCLNSYLNIASKSFFLKQIYIDKAKKLCLDL
ncbi:hypothetical protein EHP00_880 [Ecytonucleospora hepatopenaei]|uniref:Uncharacterized protein n=1 Tax=Ecytonucleospora hepatopenaei TaxID=646526 RepID=A0A1W0E3V7_9MICR|nr:hypothetical protein EHP00_880 [Ecytonucleospora hepatopenaei]